MTLMHHKQYTFEAALYPLKLKRVNGYEFQTNPGDAPSYSYERIIYLEDGREIIITDFELYTWQKEIIALMCWFRKRSIAHPPSFNDYEAFELSVNRLRVFLYKKLQE